MIVQKATSISKKIRKVLLEAESEGIEFFDCSMASTRLDIQEDFYMELDSYRYDYWLK